MIAAEARHRVDFAHRRPKAIRHAAQDFISDRAAVVVVDRLEAIEIDQQQSDLAVAAPRVLHRLLQAGVEQQPVGKARQRIGMSQRLQLAFVFAQPGVGRFQFGGARGHAPLEARLGSLQGPHQLMLGRQRLALGSVLLAPQPVDAIGQGKGEQQHLQCRADLNGIEAEKGGRQQVQVAQADDGDAQQQDSPCQKEGARTGLVVAPATNPGKHRHQRERNAGERSEDGRQAVGRNQGRNHEQGKQRGEADHGAVQARHAVPRIEEAPGEQGAEQPSSGEAGRIGHVAPYGPGGPEKLVTQPAEGELPHGHAGSEQHIGEIGVIAQRDP